MIVRIHEIGERATCAVSAALIITGLFTLSLSATWPERGAGTMLVLGASLALAAWRWPVRALGWTLAVLGAPVVALALARL